jgi:tRNA threonylcarbamoyladenosine biosynthesis protein TsaB
MILAIKTDNPQAELYLYESESLKTKDMWEAGNKMSLQLNEHIENIVAKDYMKISGIVVFQGPGSFTGLRIGMTVANTLAYSLKIPIVGAMGKEWLKDGKKALKSAKSGAYVMPVYGAEPNITIQKK